MTRTTGTAALTLLVAFGLLTPLGAGSLDPQGPPAPTMKTLVDVEPRLALSGGSGSTTIRAADTSYYLTGSRTGVPGADGIVIDASDVTLDLNGYSLVGVPGSLDGIRVAAGRTNVTIRNGTVSGWGGDGLDGSAGSSVLVVDVHASGNTEDGIRVGVAGRVINGGATGNGADGFDASGEGAVLENCSARGNGALTASSGGFRVAYGLARGCSSVGTVGGGHGFMASTGAVIIGCAAHRNEGAGIRISDRGRAESNECDGNGIGILTFQDGVVKGNHVTNNGIGIQCGNGPLVIGNMASGNATSYDFAALCRHGALEYLNGGAITSTNDAANLLY